MRALQEHELLSEQLADGISTDVERLIRANIIPILQDVAAALDQSPGGAEVTQPIVITIPLAATAKSIRFNTALEWKVQTKHKDETEDTVLSNEPKLPGME